MDKTELSKKEDSPVRDSVDNLLTTLGDEPVKGIEGTQTAEGGAPENPYDGFSDNSVSVKAEAWTKDRTPAEGDVARNDHLEGMLRNQGYEAADIYKKDADGLTLIDRVAKANDLKDPNLIHPDQELVLPTRHTPEVSSEASAEASTVGDDSPATAEARAETKADKVENGKAKADADAVAKTEGDRSNAEAVAKANVEVGEAKNAVVEADAKAKASTKGEDSQALALADAKAKVETAENSVVKADADAVASTEGSRSDADAAANATVDVGTAKDSTVEAEAKAKATATGADSHAAAVADANVAIEKAEDTSVASNAVAEAESAKANADALAGSNVEIADAERVEIASRSEAIAGAPEIGETPSQPESADLVSPELGKLPEAEPVAESSVTPELAPAALPDPVHIIAETTGGIEDASGIAIADVAEASKDGGSADQDLTVENNRAQADFLQSVDAVAPDIAAIGSKTSSDQDADFAGDGSMTLGQVSDAEVADQSAVNHEVETDPFTGTRFDDQDKTFVEQVVSEGDNSDQSATGIKNVRQVADGREFAGMGSDAQNARYEGAANKDLNIAHTGVNGTVAVEMEADKIYFKDGEHSGMRMNMPTGNRIAGDIISDDAKLDMGLSESFNGRLQGTDESADSRHELILPNPQTDSSGNYVERSGNESNLVVDSAGGKDFLGLTGGAANVSASKTEGELKMYVQPEAAQNTEFSVDGGKAKLTGTVDLRNIEEAMVQIRGGSADSDAKYLAGGGENDTVVVHLGDGQEPGAGTQYEGFENVVYVRNGEVVQGAGQGSQEFEDFDLVAARIAEAAAQG